MAQPLHHFAQRFPTASCLRIHRCLPARHVHIGNSQQGVLQIAKAQLRLGVQSFGQLEQKLEQYRHWEWRGWDGGWRAGARAVGHVEEGVRVDVLAGGQEEFLVGISAGLVAF